MKAIICIVNAVKKVLRSFLGKCSLIIRRSTACTVLIVANACDDRIVDNGWVLILNMEHIKQYSSTFGMPASDISANWIFDHGYVTWVGITPNDSETRNLERAEILELAKTDMKAYLSAMKNWGKARELRFSQQGWRKMQC